MKKYRVCLLLLLSLALLPTCEAWGFETHRVVTSAALAALPEDAADVFGPHEAAIVSASTLPDTWRAIGDPRGALEYHLCYPSGYGSAPEAVQTWYDALVGHIREGDAAAAGFDAGIMSHYLGDALCPLHTDAYVPIHPTIETYVNAVVGTMPLTVGAPIGVEHVAETVRFASLQSHERYRGLVTAGNEGAWEDVYTICSEQLSAYATLYVSLLLSAYEEASPVEEEDGLGVLLALAMATLVIASLAILALRSRRCGQEGRLPP